MLDDDQIILELYRNYLEAKGYEVFATTNAYQFVRYAQEVVPEVLIMDVNMPEVLGWEVLTRIERFEKLREIPVVMLSVGFDVDLAAVKGAAHFLHKPAEMDELMEIVEAYTLGAQEKDLLLLEKYDPEFDALAEDIKRHSWSCFRLHNADVAVHYLRKNRPHLVCVRTDEAGFARVRPMLNHPKVHRIEGIDNIVDLMKE